MPLIEIYLRQVKVSKKVFIGKLSINKYFILSRLGKIFLFIF